MASTEKQPDDLDAARDLLIPVLYGTWYPEMEPGEYEEAKKTPAWFSWWSERADKIIALFPRLREVKECEWREPENGPWATACGQSFTFEYAGDGPGGDDPDDMRFCCFCGGRLKAIPYADPQAEEDFRFFEATPTEEEIQRQKDRETASVHPSLQVMAFGVLRQAIENKEIRLPEVQITDGLTEEGTARQLQEQGEIEVQLAARGEPIPLLPGMEPAPPRYIIGFDPARPQPEEGKLE